MQLLMVLHKFQSTTNALLFGFLVFFLSFLASSVFLVFCFVFCNFEHYNFISSWCVIIFINQSSCTIRLRFNSSPFFSSLLSSPLQFLVCLIVCWMCKFLIHTVLFYFFCIYSDFLLSLSWECLFWGPLIEESGIQKCLSCVLLSV